MQLFRYLPISEAAGTLLSGLLLSTTLYLPISEAAGTLLSGLLLSTTLYLLSKRANISNNNMSDTWIRTIKRKWEGLRRIDRGIDRVIELLELLSGKDIIYEEMEDKKEATEGLNNGRT